jgi:hypothetical protein
LGAGHTVPANAISGRLFRASILRRKRKSSHRARWPPIRRWINRSAEIKEMELSPSPRNPGVLAGERHHNHFQRNFPEAHAGNAFPNAFARKCGLPLFYAATPALLVARPSLQHPDYCNPSLLSPAVHGGSFRARCPPPGLASSPRQASPDAQLFTVCRL